MPRRKGDAPDFRYPDPERINHPHARDDLVPAADSGPSVYMHRGWATLDHAQCYHIPQHRNASHQRPQ